MKHTNTHICLNLTTKQVCVYGNKKVKSGVIQTLHGQYDAHWNVKNELIKLDDLNIPADSMIRVARRFGTNLERLHKELSADENELTAIMNTEHKAILLSFKNRDAAEQVKPLRQKILSYIEKSEKDHTEVERLGECTACFDEICDSENMYILQVCGHVYCVECARSTIRYGLNDKRLPLCCDNPDCGKPFCLKDILALTTRFVRGGLQRLVDVMRDVFVQKNFEDYCYCFRPTCPGVVKKEGTETWVCPLCYGKQCAKCAHQFHKGYTCEQYMNLISINEWMDRSPNRKKCPSCSMGIEKISGCNHVHCVFCHRSICWVCMQHFPNATQCYDHLNATHGNVY